MALRNAVDRPDPAAAWPARSLVAQVPADLRAEFLRLGSVRKLSRGHVLIAETTNTTEVHLILQGFVRVLNHTFGGDQVMIAIRTRGDVIGELAALDGQPRISSVIAAGPVTVRLIDAPRFRAFLADHPVMGAVIARSVASKLRTATRHRAETGQSSVLIRVARALEHLADGYGRAVTDGILIDVPLSQRDLASLVAASDRGVTRSYDELRQAGVIKVEYRRVVVLDLQVLHEYADGIRSGDDRAPTA